MARATLTSKGQITIPVQIRTALGVDAGDQIEFIETETGQFAVIPAVTPVQRLKGMIQKPATPVSIEEMNSAIAKHRSKSSLPKK